ncbi:MAG: hypothetical protein F2889_01565, partial [Actinobacteria bacterium]|nr:hypothetical protein [Actinomycetota bacterium]
MHRAMVLLGRVWRNSGVRAAGSAALVALTSGALLLAAPGAGAADPAPTGSASETASATASASASATASASASATASPSATPSPSATATPTPTPTTQSPSADVPTTPVEPVAVLPAELGSWCLAIFPPLKPSVERERAQALMNGNVNLKNGGTYTLTEHPNWRPQATSDTSGDRHVHSLNWALPLLYRGVHKQIPEMVDRFRQILTYWIED